MSKLKFKAGGDSDCKVDMTPMIDVTFQLIAFFMFVLNVNDAAQNQAVRLPASEIARPPEKVVRTVLTVQVTRPEADGRSYVHFGNQRYALDSDDLKLAIQKERQFLEYQRKSPSDPNLVIVVRGDALARYGDVRQVIETWRSEQFSGFSLRTRQEKD